MSRDLYDSTTPLMSGTLPPRQNPLTVKTILPILDLYLALLPFLTSAERGVLSSLSKNSRAAIAWAEKENERHPFSPDFVRQSTMRGLFAFFSALLKAGWRGHDVSIQRIVPFQCLNSGISTLSALQSSDSLDSSNAAIGDLAHSAPTDFLDDLIGKIEAVMPPNERKNKAMAILAILLLPVQAGLWAFAMLGKNKLMLGNSCCADSCFIDSCETVSCDEIMAGSSDAQNWLSDRSDIVLLTWAQEQCVAFFATELCNANRYSKLYTMIDGDEAAGISVGCNITLKTGLAWGFAAALLLLYIAALVKFRSQLLLAALPATITIDSISNSKKIPFSEVSNALGFLKSLKEWRVAKTAAAEAAALEASSLPERKAASVAFLAEAKASELDAGIPTSSSERGDDHVAIQMDM